MGTQTEMRLRLSETKMMLLIVSTLLAFNLFYPSSMKDEVWFWNCFTVTPSALITILKKAGLSQAYRDEWAMAVFSSGVVFLINALTHPGERLEFLVRFILGLMVMTPSIHLLRAVRDYLLPHSWKNT